MKNDESYKRTWKKVIMNVARNEIDYLRLSNVNKIFMYSRDRYFLPAENAACNHATRLRITQRQLFSKTPILVAWRSR